MTMLERIYHDGLSWNFSEYFEYLREVEAGMPGALRAFACNVESYSLHGNQTLHDARLLSVVVRKAYMAQFTSGTTLVEISLVDQLFEGTTMLRYGGVSGFLFREASLTESGHADVLLHEFSIVRTGVYRHRIILDHNGELQIDFSEFSHQWERFDS